MFMRINFPEVCFNINHGVSNAIKKFFSHGGKFYRGKNKILQSREINVLCYGYKKERNYKEENAREQKIWIIVYPKFLQK
jgi:hypothetical protein